MSGLELAVSAVLPVLLERLTSPELLQFLHQKGLHSKIETWENNLNMINLVLRKAEEKQVEQEEVQKHLDQLQDLAYDVEDMLDEFATDVLAKDLKKKQHEQASTSKFHKFVSTKMSKVSLKAMKSRVRKGSEIKDVKHRLERVTSQMEQLCKLKDNLGLKERGTSNVVSKTRLPTTSIQTELFYGREEDKEKILKMVFSDKPSVANFHVIQIVGMGGIGKTTLARKVFNDEVVKSFELKAWVCVSTDFDVLKISKAIFENITYQPCNLTELNVVQKQLQENIAGKKFLFVLDDVWSKDGSLWETLMSPFVAGASGSQIIVTTRDETVALTMRRSTRLYGVPLLSNADCWSLFKAHAFDDGVDPTHPSIQSLQKKVVEKCKGLPLASKVLGGLLCGNGHIDEWLEILNSKMWDLVDESDIPPTLKLSYFYLPSYLKRCFAYCSIFLEDYEFKEEELVHLWLTEGLIQPSKANKELEDLGHDYFNDLLSRSLFQRSSSNKAKYVMHDLLRDLAQWASRGTCFHLAVTSNADEQLKSLEKARHLSYGKSFLDGKSKFEVISKIERVEQRLRTFLPLDAKRVTYSYISPTVVFDLLPKFKKLRMLSLEDYLITELPESIGDLRHLRHLNLSNTRINHLPESTSSLINLLILKLKGCSRLRKLPSEMRNLTKLRYLDIRDVRLDEMPLGIDELKDLRCLSNFIVGEDVGATLKVLKNLKYLREEICISRLENVVDLDEINEMILNDKQKLRVLKLEWNSQFDDTRNANKEKQVLNLLQPHKGLERLTIKSYGGMEFPSWVGASSFFKLTILTLESCVSCTNLPSLGLLESLKDLTIRGMKGLKRIGNEFCGQQCSKPFRSLETLRFEDLQEWKHWEPIKENDHGVAFPCLRVFSIQNCPKLCGSLPSRLHSMENFVIEHCPQLVVSFSSLPKLCNLDINGCREMTCVDPIDLKSLKSITLSNIEEFGDWTEQDCFRKTELLSFPVICYFSNLCKLEITYCNALTSLPMEMNHRNTCLESLKLSKCKSLKFIINGPLPSSLKRLEIESCDKLEYLWDDREVSCTSIADSFHDNISLEEINIVNCEKLTTISNGLHNCSRLQKVEIEGCKSIVKLAEDGLPKDKLSTLRIWNCGKLEGLPKGFHSLDSLEDLTLSGCPSMSSFPEEGFPTNLTSLKIYDEVNIYKPLLEWGLHNLTILESLYIYGRPKAESSFVEQEMGMRLPFSLTYLSIKQFPNSKWVLSQDFRNLNSLEWLEIIDCPDLTSFPKVALPSSLQSLYIDHCPALTSISELGLPSSLQSLDIQQCPALTSISELGLPSSLQSLSIWACSSLTSISDLGLPSSLQSLSIMKWSSLTSISDLGLPSSLLKLSINGCSKLRFLTEQCLPSSLLELRISDCAKLKEECKRDKGKVWPNISHIPKVLIDGESIDELF